MDIQTFLTECLVRGIRIILDGDLIRVESDGELKPATAEFIRSHKAEIIEVLSDQQHGACFHCGIDTESMLTKPGAGWMWCCPACFDRGAEVSANTQKPHRSDAMKPNNQELVQ